LSLHANVQYSWLRYVAALLLFASSSISLGAQSNAPTLKLQISNEKEIVLFDHAKDACEAWDIPDTPTRAYRGADGLVHVFQTHFLNRPMVGKTLLSAKRQCHIAFKGDENDDPSKFNDRGWIASTYTEDGKTIYGIVHNEFQGHRRPKLCPTKDYMSCWYNALTMVVSKDGGGSFKPMKPSLLAALPYRQSETVGHHAGVFEPTNIVKHGKYLYFMSNVVSPNKASNGTCLFRTKSWQDKNGWQVWRDNTFSNHLGNPYDPDTIVSKKACTPVDPANLYWPVKSLIKHESTKIWIAVMMGSLSSTKIQQAQKGVFYSTSKDLLKWSYPQLLLASPTNFAFECKGDSPISYPALIDVDSSSRNFDTASNDHIYLTFVKSVIKDCKISNDRDLIAIKVDIIQQPKSLIK
jgi:hypothetical protein